MKLTKQQIIDYVNAGYEIEISSFNNTYTIIRIINKDTVVCLDNNSMQCCDENFEDCINDEVLSIKPRPFTPLPNGTKVEWNNSIWTIENYIIDRDAYDISKPGDSNRVHTPFIAPIIEEQEKKEEWEDEFDKQFFSVRLDRVEKNHNKVNEEIKEFIKNLLENNK